MVTVAREHDLPTLDSTEIRNLDQKLNKDKYKNIIKHLVSYPTWHSLSVLLKEQRHGPLSSSVIWDTNNELNHLAYLVQKLGT